MTNRANPPIIRTLFLALATVALIILPACGKKEAHGPEGEGETKEHQEGEVGKEGKGHDEGDHAEIDHEAGEEGHEEEDHECTGKHGEGEDQIPCPTCPNQPSDANWLIDIGDHKYLGRIDVFSKEGRVVLNVYDHHTKEAFSHEISEVTLNVVLDDGSRRFKMVPLRGDEDLVGETSRYKVVDPALKGKTALKGRINITLEGKAYLCELKAAH
jgi:hypothetical protein